MIVGLSHLEEGCSVEELGEDAAQRPDVHLRVVVGGTEEELRSPVVAGHHLVLIAAFGVVGVVETG